MHVKRVLAAASIVGAAGLPISFLGATVACADPASGTAVGAPGQPLPADPAVDGQQNQQSSTSGDSGAIVPANIGDEIARGLSQLPPPNLSGLPAPQLNVPVNIGLPGVGLGLVPDLSVPIVLGGLAAPQLPAFQLPPIAPPQIAPPQFPPLPF